MLVSGEARALRYQRVVRYRSPGCADVLVERSDIGDTNNRAGP